MGLKEKFKSAIANAKTNAEKKKYEREYEKRILKEEEYKAKRAEQETIKAEKSAEASAAFKERIKRAEERGKRRARGFGSKVASGAKAVMKYAKSRPAPKRRSTPARQSQGPNLNNALFGGSTSRKGKKPSNNIFDMRL